MATDLGNEEIFKRHVAFVHTHSVFLVFQAI